MRLAGLVEGTALYSPIELEVDGWDNRRRRQFNIQWKVRGGSPEVSSKSTLGPHGLTQPTCGMWDAPHPMALSRSCLDQRRRR